MAPLDRTFGDRSRRVLNRNAAEKTEGIHGSPPNGYDKGQTNR